MGTRFAFSLNLVDRKLADSYEIDRKMSLLITMTSIVLAGLFVVVDSLHEHSKLALGLWMGATATSTASLIVCTYFLVPNLRSGISDAPSLRTVRGVGALSYDDFRAEVMRASTEDLVLENLDQVKKVNHIILLKSRVARKAVLLTRLSGAFFLLLLFTQAMERLV